MISQKTHRLPAVAWLAAFIITSGCSSGMDRIDASMHAPNPISADAVPTASTGFVISQVYGGGGNSGATYKNDFIELYNGTATDINLSGWSVQYSSSAGSTWQVTNLAGTLLSGHYYLVQESQGSGGTTALPTPDASGTILMSATAAKVALVHSTAAMSGTGCPFTAGSVVVDFVGFGSGANCFEGTTGVAPAPSNTAADIRKNGGQQDNNDNAGDFATGAPNPRNSSNYLAPVTSLSVSISPASPAVIAGSTVNFTASASQGGQPVTITSATWTSSNPSVATIDATTGVATTIASGTTTIGVTAVTANGNASSSTTLTATSAPANVTVSPTTWTLKTNQTKTFTATATDAGGNTVAATYAWSSSNTSVATIDPSTGLATGHQVGSATITATTSNNVSGTATINVTAGNISVQSRADPLPVGFQTQFFINNGSSDSNGNPVGNADVNWSTSNATIATVNASTGVVTARGAGSVSIIATAKSDGISSGTTTLTVDVEATSPSARVGHNTELGTPADADPSDDVIIARRQYTISYNPARGGPNWVSWNLDLSHKGSANRCNCFTADTALTRLGYPAYDTQDWVNGGVWSRGHQSPSADWADTPGDNAPTFFLSNMLPQNQKANAGAWGDLENYLRTLVNGSAEVYIVAGGVFTKNRSGPGLDGFGFMNSSGHIAVPDSIWKIAIVVPDARSASQITSPSDVTVIAVNMPNDSLSTGTYSRFTTTIDKIQKSTGYDFLSALPEGIQCRLETRNCAPVANIAAASGLEGSAIAFDASGSTDADGDALTYAWTFGDGATGTGVAPAHTYADNGQYTVSVTVTDGHGGSNVFSRTVSVSNVAPAPQMNPVSTTVRAGVAFDPKGLFTDPGTHDATWRVVFAWGDGTSLTANFSTIPTSIRASKAYSTPGTYTVRMTATDKDNGSAFVERTITVTP